MTIAGEKPWNQLLLDGPLLKGRTAVITGTGSQIGIGRATAQLFVTHGARIASLDVDAEGAEQTAAQLGSDHLAVVCDVSSKPDCQAAATKILKEFGRIDILINNAGVSRATAFMDIETEEYDLLMDVNVKGTFFMSQAVIPDMLARKAGNIVCVASLAGQRGGGGLYGSTHYAAAKSGVIGLAKGMARELAPQGIRVNTVSPNLIVRALPDPKNPPIGRMDATTRAKREKEVPLGRSGSIWEVAGAILFAASDLSGYVVGATIDVNGGSHIH